jgi:hypothetical protein
MYQLARNVSADNYRKHGREGQAPEDPPEIVDSAPLVAETLERSETERRMRRALKSLPAEKREVLVLSRYQRLKYDQIADLLGCSVGPSSSACTGPSRTCAMPTTATSPRPARQGRYRRESPESNELRRRARNAAGLSRRRVAGG